MLTNTRRPVIGDALHVEFLDKTVRLKTYNHISICAFATSISLDKADNNASSSSNNTDNRAKNHIQTGIIYEAMAAIWGPFKLLDPSVMYWSRELRTFDIILTEMGTKWKCYCDKVDRETPIVDYQWTLNHYSYWTIYKKYCS